MDESSIRTSIRMKPKYARKLKIIDISRDEWSGGYTIFIDSKRYGQGFNLAGVKSSLKEIGLTNTQIRNMYIEKLRIQGFYRRSEEEKENILKRFGIY